jgi:hypothetical protein
MEPDLNPSDEDAARALLGARGSLGDQVAAMEREFQKLEGAGEEIPPLAAEMLQRLKALASALDQLETSLSADDRKKPPAE